MTAPAIRHPGELRWETRLMAVLTATLVVWGVASTAGAAALLTNRSGESVALGFATRQLSGALIGGLAMVILSRVDYQLWRKLAWPILFITIGFLLIPLLPFTHSISREVNGARRWVDIGPINFQPSEIARLAIVIWCAALAAKKGAQIREFKKGLLPFLVVVGFVSLLVFLEPNLSMAILVAFGAGIVMFTAGAKVGHFLLLGAIAMPVVYTKIVDTQYRAARLE
jgi:cell division protein FtsW